ncbi:hypothetical protein UFOVP1100_1, partial [uncultured Caudovirales phage]
NELAKYTLAQAKRSDELQNKMLAGLQGATTIEQQAAVLRSVGKVKEAQELLGSGLTQRKTLGEITAQDIKANHDKLEAFGARIAPLAARVAGGQEITHDDVFAVANQLKSQGLLDDTNIRAIPMDARQLPAYVMGLATATENARKALETHIPKALLANDSLVNTNPMAGKVGDVLATVPMSAFNTQRLGLMGRDTAAREQQVRTGQGQLGVAQAGLGLRAINADPFNMSGAQDAFPLRPNNLGTGPTPPAASPTAPTAPTSPIAKPGEASLSGKTMSIKEAIAQRLTGDALLSVLPFNLASQVALITDHRSAPPQRDTLRGGQLMQLVAMVDPNYDATQFKTKQGIETAFTSGRLGNTLRSLNVVQDHLGTFNEVAKNLGNDSVQFTNVMGNQIAKWTGQPAPTDFAAVKNIVADELTKAIIGTAGALGDRTEMKANISAANSPAQLAGVIDKWQKLIAGQVKGLKDQYKSGGGTNKAVEVLFERAGSTTSTATPAAGKPPLTEIFK